MSIVHWELYVCARAHVHVLLLNITLWLLVFMYALSIFLTPWVCKNASWLGWLLVFFSQDVPPTPGQPVKEPMFIPVAVGLLDSNGKDMPLTSVYHEGLLQAVTSNGQPVSTTVLRVTKVVLILEQHPSCLIDQWGFVQNLKSNPMPLLWCLICKVWVWAWAWAWAWAGGRRRMRKLEKRAEEEEKVKWAGTIAGEWDIPAHNVTLYVMTGEFPAHDIFSSYGWTRLYESLTFYVGISLLNIWSLYVIGGNTPSHDRFSKGWTKSFIFYVRGCPRSIFEVNMRRAAIFSPMIEFF